MHPDYDRLASYADFLKDELIAHAAQLRPLLQAELRRGQEVIDELAQENARLKEEPAQPSHETHVHDG